MEENKIIAEFMGVVFHDDENQYYNEDGLYVGNTLQYHTSWDWLMPVIEKIESTEPESGLYEFRININETVIVSSQDFNVLLDVCNGYRLENTYNAVVEFINQTKTK